MELLTFLVQGRSETPYTVEFLRKPGSTNMTATCTCRAAVFGNFCKHRIQLLTGNPKGLVSENENEIKLVTQMLSGTDIESALREFFIKEKAYESASAEFKIVKKQLTRAMDNNGENNE